MKLVELKRKKEKEGMRQDDGKKGKRGGEERSGAGLLWRQ